MWSRRATVVLTTAAVLAAPVLAGCSNTAEDDVRTAAQSFLDDWSHGRTDQAAKLTTDAGAATTLDIVDAETAVSVARGNLLRGLYDYSVGRANLRWSSGQTPWE